MTSLIKARRIILQISKQWLLVSYIGFSLYGYWFLIGLMQYVIV